MISSKRLRKRKRMVNKIMRKVVASEMGIITHLRKGKMVIVGTVPGSKADAMVFNHIMDMTMYGRSYVSF